MHRLSQLHGQVCVRQGEEDWGVGLRGVRCHAHTHTLIYIYTRMHSQTHTTVPMHIHPQIIGTISRVMVTTLAVLPVQREGYLSDNDAVRRFMRRPNTIVDGIILGQKDLVLGYMAALAGRQYNRRKEKDTFAGRLATQKTRRSCFCWSCDDSCDVGQHDCGRHISWELVLGCMVHKNEQLN